MKIYIAGKITGDPQYRKKFKTEEKRLLSRGHEVMNPAILPDGFEYHQYLRINKAMIKACDAILFLTDWNESRGATIEHEWAKKMKKKVIYSGRGELI